MIAVFRECDDKETDTIGRLLRENEIECNVRRDKLLHTSVKLRVISQNQQLIRVDFDVPASKDCRARLLDDYHKQLPEFHVVMASDDGNGGLGYIQGMTDAARDAGIPVVVDPKGGDYSAHHRADLLTLNRKEFKRVTGRFRNESELEQKAKAMAVSMELGAVAITRGQEGVSLVKRSGEVLHYRARAREVFDVTGAGDIEIATLACGFAAGGAPEDVLHLANAAAGIVVGKLGAASATPEEILHELAIERA